MPAEMEPLEIKYLQADKASMTNFDLYKCPHNHTYIYSLNVDYTKNITLKINNEIVETYVNKYPSFENEIIFSTLVKFEDNYIKQWIDFHLNIGVSRFIIYDNAESIDSNSRVAWEPIRKRSNLPRLLRSYISKGVVILIKWPYPHRTTASGISGQTTQQNHSIYAFKNSKYIGLFDIDEYVNMQKRKNLQELFKDIIRKNKIDTNTIGSFRVLCRNFFNPNKSPSHGNKFLAIFNCGEIIMKGREKNFVLPKNINTFAVHTVTDGKPMHTVDKEEMYFNHYTFLNKANRGLDETYLKDSSILLHIDK